MADPETADGPPARWKGPGQWRSWAESVQDGDPDPDEVDGGDDE